MRKKIVIFIKLEKVVDLHIKHNFSSHHPQVTITYIKSKALMSENKGIGITRKVINGNKSTMKS